MEKQNPTHITEWFQRNQWFNRCGKHLGGGWYKARIANALSIGQITHHHSPVLKKQHQKGLNEIKHKKLVASNNNINNNNWNKKLPAIKMIDILVITGLQAWFAVICSLLNSFD